MKPQLFLYEIYLMFLSMHYSLINTRVPLGTEFEPGNEEDTLATAINIQSNVI